MNISLKVINDVEEVNDKCVVSITNNHGKTIYEYTYNAYPVIIDDHTVHLTYYVNNDWEEKEELIVLD